MSNLKIKKNNLLAQQLTNEELLQELSTRMKKGEILTDWSDIYEGEGCNVLYLEDKKQSGKSLLLSLYDYEIEKEEEDYE